ncbi:carboxylating nicotinate-nucleotide diphosphorylase [Kibdelosporangium phytohabitans]|uniref:Nicotinate-nucleotide pyrophosphorylase [carboxylating] n=1 Tax=Kibdelosporangium phytohabitans TaxID=860235 RepID=A0A0N9IHW5_9PSEU|nr:carboxylating nicotinate-nucleotide diphosphorylase [Kibdelosporangium phytohabitans]ALG14557.1 hypothetical protein AOZ06_05130 [Kibdelosporangium phytohabitans]MBE1467538.1 nicotinate-nucleotide pyrophosphorylase (carboxylating) [Kibdelosporangium phytohabitans]
MNAMTWATDRLARAGLTNDEITDTTRLITTALSEDLACGPDPASQLTIASHAATTMEIVARQDGVLAGGPIAAVVFETVGGPHLDTCILCPDGAHVTAGTPVLRVHGRHRQLLIAERIALNLMGHLSGIATTTQRWVHALDGTGCIVRDTRSALPGLRRLQTYAVRRGGGQNHHTGRGQRILIQQHHIVHAGSLGAAVSAVRRHAPHRSWEVEVDTIDQLDEALDLGAELIIFDAATLTDCVYAVGRRDRVAPNTSLEVSGRLTLELARAYADTGVDYLALDVLTHSSPSLDLAMSAVATHAGLSP